MNFYDMYIQFAAYALTNPYNDLDIGLTKKQRETHIEPIRTTPKIGRNEPCSCGSGKKYKHCCIHND